MNYAQDFDRLPIFEQEAVALFVSSWEELDTFKINIDVKKEFTISVS